MATQGKRGASQAAADDSKAEDGGVTAATGSIAETARQQMAMAAEMTSAVFRSCESLQQAQLHMGQRAALLHQQAADNIRKATSPMELMTVQSTLLAYEWQEAFRYWQELMMASARVGTEVLRPASAMQQAGLDGAPTQAPSAASPAAMMGAAMHATAPMAEVFQQMFTAPLQAAGRMQTH